MRGAHQLEVEVGKGGVDLGGVLADLGGSGGDVARAAVVVDGVGGEEGGDRLGVAGIPGAKVVAHQLLAGLDPLRG